MVLRVLINRADNQPVMAMIDIEYRHTEKAIDDVTVRRTTTGKMVSYIQDLIYEMKSADIDCSFR